MFLSLSFSFPQSPFLSDLILFSKSLSRSFCDGGDGGTKRLPQSLSEVQDRGVCALPQQVHHKDWTSLALGYYYMRGKKSFHFVRHEEREQRMRNLYDALFIITTRCCCCCCCSDIHYTLKRSTVKQTLRKLSHLLDFLPALFHATSK